MKIKRFVYIFLWVVLGIIISTIIHALIEIPVLKYLVSGLNWSQWQIIHDIGSVILFVLGILGGCLAGKYWWRIIYFDKKFKK